MKSRYLVPIISVPPGESTFPPKSTRLQLKISSAMKHQIVAVLIILAPVILAGRAPLRKCGGLFCAGALVATAGHPAPVWASAVAVQQWKSPEVEAPVVVDLPTGWYISSRPGSGSTGEAGVKTLVSALDLKSGFVASVSVTPVRELLQDFYGMDTTMGRVIGSLKDLGPPDRLAKLLQRQRDGSLKQAPLTSEVEAVEESNGLTFRSETVFKPVERVRTDPRGPFGAPAPRNPVSDETAAVAAKSIVRITQSRTFLSGRDLT
eukprot:scaffold8556_cov286-Pinguiococcus_pyrenoidosus.AAC.4